MGFDYDGAEFTHVKNRVTFEVLAAAFELDRDPALAQIAAAVHFLDVGGIPVPDATGLETMLKGAKEKARGDDACSPRRCAPSTFFLSLSRPLFGMTPSVNGFEQRRGTAKRAEPAPQELVDFVAGVHGKARC